MGKLSVFFAAVLALVLGGCAGQVDGPEVFEIRADQPFVADLCSAAAERINPEERVTVVVRYVSIAPGSELPNAVWDVDGFGAGEMDRATLSLHAHTSSNAPIPGYALEVGEEASVDAVEAAIRDWIEILHPESSGPDE
jgi:hypothetical protein